MPTDLGTASGRFVRMRIGNSCTSILLRGFAGLLQRLAQREKQSDPG